MMTPPVVGLAAIAGLALGSYAVTAAIRFSRSEPSAFGRSHCDSCGQTLGFAQTVPVISYLRTGGACGHCQARIDPMHLGGELAGLGVMLCACLSPDLIRIPILAVLGLLLVAAAAIDWKVGRLPDFLSAPIAGLGLLLAAQRSLAALEAGLIAAAVTLLLLQILRWVAMRRRRDAGLGLGDVKIMAALALWLGAATPLMVVGAAVLGLGMMALARPADGRLSFGPALALAGWTAGMIVESGLWPMTL